MAIDYVSYLWIMRDCQELVHMQHQSIKYQAESHLNRDYCKWENLAIFSVDWLYSMSTGYIFCRIEHPHRKIYTLGVSPVTRFIFHSPLQFKYSVISPCLCLAVRSLMVSLSPFRAAVSRRSLGLSELYSSSLLSEALLKWSWSDTSATSIFF